MTELMKHNLLNLFHPLRKMFLVRNFLFLMLLAWFMPQNASAYTARSADITDSGINRDGNNLVWTANIWMFNYDGKNAYFVGDVYFTIDGKDVKTLNSVWDKMSVASSTYKTECDESTFNASSPSSFNKSSGNFTYNGTTYSIAFSNLQNKQNNVSGQGKWSKVKITVTQYNSWAEHTFGVRGTWRDWCDEEHADKAYSASFTGGYPYVHSLKAQRSGAGVKLSWGTGGSAWASNGHIYIFDGTSRIMRVSGSDKSYTISNVACGSEKNYYVVFVQNALDVPSSGTAYPGLYSSVSYKQEHVFATTFTTDLEPGCVTQGSKSYHCNYCTAKKDVTPIADLGGHIASSANATYSWEGSSYYEGKCKATLKCGRCSNVIEEADLEVTSSSHIESTCTEQGTREWSAEGHIEQFMVEYSSDSPEYLGSLLEHTPDEDSSEPEERLIKRKATCLECAEYYFRCTMCNGACKEYFEYGDPLPHTFDKANDPGEGECTVCHHGFFRYQADSQIESVKGLLDANGDTCISHTFDDSQGVVEFAKPLTKIGNRAFSESKLLKGSLVIPNSVTSIEIFAFDSCKGLNKVVIGNGVTYIGESAFNTCTGLKELTIGNSVTTIWGYAFSDCRSLNGDLVIPESVTSIQHHAFYNCKGFDGNIVICGNPTIGDKSFVYMGIDTLFIKGTKMISSVASSAFTFRANSVLCVQPSLVASYKKSALKDFSKIVCLPGMHSYGDNDICLYCQECILPSKAEDGYYEIATAGHLYGFASMVNGGSKDIKARLTNDIVVNTNVLDSDRKLIGDGSNFLKWTPIDGFSGEFDGNGHTISGLYFNDGTAFNGTGLFKTINGGTVKHVGVVDTYFYYGRAAGGICGKASGATITNCYFDGRLHSFSDGGFTGGICGDIDENTTQSTNISNCYAAFGHSYDNDGGNQYYGNISGHNKNVTVTNSYGNYDSGDSGLGDTKSESAFASGEICYLLNGSTAEGELVWYQKIGTDKYPTFKKADDATVYYGFASCGDEKMGYSNTVSTLYKNHEIASTFDSNGFAECSKCHKTVTQSLGSPVDGYYMISNAGQLYSFADMVNNGAKDIKAKLANDIVVNTNVLNSNRKLIGDGSAFRQWTPIDGFSGEFDGNGHTISGLYFNDAYAYGTGLFKSISGGTVQHVGVVDTYFGYRMIAGGICGNAKGATITNCYFDGMLYSSDDGSYSGGICGDGYNKDGQTSNISNCYAAFCQIVTESGSSIMGGIAGNNQNITVTNSYGNISNGEKGLGTEKSESDFASGEVCYLLNGATAEGELVWYQKIGTDKYPTFKKADDATVYYGYASCTDTEKTYSNTALAETPEHVIASTFDSNGFAECSKCHMVVTQPLGSPVDGYYMISNAGQLYSFADMVNNGAKDIKAKLANDIVVNTNVLDSNRNLIGNGSDFRQWTPISGFSGEFDGNGCTISGLYFNDDKANDIGLFKSLNGATVKHVGVVDTYFGYKRTAGGICGNASGATITNCYFNGRLQISIYGDGTGGICGNIDVNSTQSTNISNCYAAFGHSSEQGDANLCIGNISGYNEYVTVTNSYGNISNGNFGLGDKKSESDFASGEVCYLLNGGTAQGELVWYQKIGTDKYPTFKKADDATVYYGYASCSDTEKTYSNTVRTEEVPEHVIADSNGIKECSQCHTVVETQPLGSPVDGYYMITNAGQLYSFAKMVNNGAKDIKAKLANDIVVNTNVLDSNRALIGNGSAFRQWTPIDGFSGEFDGNGCTISGLYFNNAYASDGTGLFKSLNGGTVKHVGVVDTYFRYFEYAGGICGKASGATITNCYFDGTLNSYGAGSCSGGICGDGYNKDGQTSNISNCYAAFCQIFTESGSPNMGGIAGNNQNITVTNSYGNNSNGENGLGTEKSESDFASGEVCYLLNGGAAQGELVWYQKIGTDKYPTFKKADDAIVIYDASHSPKYYNNAASTTGDVNGDTFVDIADVVALVNILRGNADTNAAADVNGDGSVNYSDIITLVNSILGKK